MRLPSLFSSPALQPTVLSSVTEQAVSELLQEGEARNTQASYRSALRYWAAWFGIRYGLQITLPVAVPAILQFIVDHAERTTPKGLAHELPQAIDTALVEAGFKGKLGPMALNTLVHRIAVLSKTHQLRELKNPCQDPKVKELLAMTRRAHAKRGALPKRKDALTKDPLQAILATCDDSLRGKRDRALLLFAWSSGGRRRSEVAGADMQFLRAQDSSSYTYELAHSKTNQAGDARPENFKPIVGAAAVALRDWLAAAQIQDGAIFRRIRKGGHLGEPLSAAAVRDIVLARCGLAGVNGNYSAHSLRSGFVTEANKRSIPLAETMAMTGHRSVQSVMGYSRVVPAQGRAARLAELD
ncbi:MAG: site-specific integrase [Ramlibacter sp.]|nr:site-specific integrase [Ramlibacter sp.]